MPDVLAQHVISLRDKARSHMHLASQCRDGGAYATRHLAISHHASSIADAIERLRSVSVSPPLAELSKAEQAYRQAHDLYGPGDLRTGRAWDQMRRAGDDVRLLLGGEI